MPLNWLSGVPSRLFSANIPALDLPGNILIIKTDGERQLSAVERIADGMFTLCKLSAHVKMKEVRRMAQLAKKALPASSDCADIGKESFQKQWWESLAIDTFAVGVVDPKGESVILSMMHHSKVKQRPEAISEATQAKDPKLPSPPAEPAEFVEPTPAEVLEQTRTQYMETLYIAKSSIAYFAKSTLSRARVTFQGDSSGSQSSTWDQLLDFLKGMLLPLDKMDIKYRKVITQIATEDDIENTGILKEGEEEYVQRWVSMNFKDKVLQINDEGLKRQIEDLKIRE